MYVFVFFTFADLISTLLQLKTDNVASVFVFLYNIKNGAKCYRGSDDDDSRITLKKLTPLVNATAALNGYIVDAELEMLSSIIIDIPLEDFGITILMLFFAEFYSQGQYPLFVHMFRTLKELELIERLLLSYNQNTIKLPPNLATHEKYGLKKQGSNFTGSAHLTVQAFQAIQSYMRSPEVTPEKFITCIRMLHIRIIESFYILTNITKDCKVINECHDLIHNNMTYTFQKPTKSLRYDGHYWFELPPKAVWFAYFQGRVKFSAYIGCDIKHSMDIFKLNNIKCIVIGFISDGAIYPLIFEDPEIYGSWSKIIEYMHVCGFNCVLRDGPPDPKNNRIHFVRNNVPTIFKLENKH
nr:TPA: gp33-like protein [Oryctes rhinoceros nudivirus]